MEQQVQRLVERDLALACDHDAPAVAGCRSSAGSIAPVDRRRLVAFEPEQDRAIGAVPTAGQRQRAIDLRRDLVDAAEHDIRSRSCTRGAGSGSSAHGVGTRRPDADLEDVGTLSSGLLSRAGPRSFLASRRACRHRPDVLIVNVRSCA